MKIEQILDIIRGLACSTGFYGRLYQSIMEMPKSARENYYTYLESLNFASDLDVVLYFEEGKMPGEPKRPPMTDNEIKKAVADQLAGMISNNLVNEFGPESFRGWLEDGDAFINAGMTEEETERAMAYAEQVSDAVDIINDVLAARYDD